MIWWVSVAMIAPLWGVLSTRWFVQALLSLCCSVVGLIGLAMGRAPRAATARLTVSSLIQSFLFLAFVILGFSILVGNFDLGYTRWERVSFAFFAALGTLLAVQRFPEQVADAWTRSMTRAGDGEGTADGVPMTERRT
jgi:hypothetical protein